ncbi:potassium channel family protein [Rhodococcus opacus]|uniref:TrkA family potassium uptake protein n=1 Tax=Rhodococcus opacus TaxID=37919 RepID=A0A1B1KCP0_RHOOP|nr:MULTISPECIES: TrkA family potassium uptake protein [Rhodococcus]NHU48160.1 TrkA family potassium uptake protein [Rhodococcus sp. A14]ANS30373.1 trkA-C domain protein [Rhodococcus opacus]MBA8962462.1 trk system potassium uptake protein TrkA [Rhodococcus opacus]MBP2209009.1 trk system potassium uptake protein TrkA [Rhodococcus opacus]MCZ4589690.1 TrkA family potassium uptake protein [Rhodococcus opacus]
MARKPSSDVVVVLGLGRFGKSLALELMEQGTEVLGIDANEVVVQKISHRLTHAAVADTTDEESLRQLSVHDYDRAVVGIGSDLEASLLTASALINLAVPHVWAKAISNAHAKILRQIGVQHVVRPEHDMGKRVAHLVRGRMMDYIEFDDGFAMVKTTPPATVVGKRLGDTTVRSTYGVTVVAIKRPGEGFTYATADTVIEPGDTIIVSGQVRDTERFSDLT